MSFVVESNDRFEIDRLTKLLINESRLCQEREIRIASLEHQLRQQQDQFSRGITGQSSRDETNQLRSDMNHLHKKYREAVADLDFARAELNDLQQRLQFAEHSRLTLHDEIQDLRDQLQSERARAVSGANLSQALLQTQRILDSSSRTKAALRSRIEDLKAQQVS